MATNRAKVLVTGALGVNGVWTLRSLVERGADVIATDVSADWSLAPELADRVGFTHLDIAALDSVEEALAAARPDCVVHLAALMPGTAQQDPFAGARVNFMGTVNVLEAARRMRVPRAVLTSSKAAYGSVVGRHGHPHYEPLPEDAPLRPNTVYDYTKIASEGLGINYASGGGPEFAALRFGNIYGPGKLARHGPMSLSSRMVEEPFAGVPVTVEHGGDEQDDFLYVRDVGDAIAAAALHPRPFAHAIYNVGTGRGTTFRDFADAVRGVLPEASFDIGGGLDPLGLGIAYYSVMDCSRAAEDLGWRARYDIHSGVRDYVEYLQRHGLPLAGRS